MDTFANLSENEKQPYYQVAAQRKNLSPNIIEKDFWVCWTLQQLFSHPKIKGHLIFKGGTSLSKAYGLIERFSEDIDISIDKSLLGFSGDRDPNKAPSNKKQQTLINELSDASKRFVQNDLLNLLQKQFEQALDSVTRKWTLKLDEDDPSGQSLLFYYPTLIKSVNDYVRPAIKIECGARGGSEPVKQCQITPFIEELIPNTLATPSAIATTLAAERTFWEKATILHMYAHYPENKIIPERQSRHYFDFYKLLNSPIKNSAMHDTELLDKVAEHKHIYFRAGWAKYNEAKVGSLKLMPSTASLNTLKNDYQKMQEMFYGKPIEWDQIIKSISLFETHFNSTEVTTSV